MTIDVTEIKKDFPVLQRHINGKPLIYLDSANTSQKPVSVMDAMEDYYRQSNANVQKLIPQFCAKVLTYTTIRCNSPNLYYKFVVKSQLIPQIVQTS